MFEYYLTEITEGKRPDIGFIGDYLDKNKRDITIRIRSITLDNFKSVRHGTIDLIEGRKPIPFSDEPSILGIYGQNGSGKTTVVRALGLLKSVLSGASIPRDYSHSMISNDAEKATMKTVFEFQDKKTEIVEIITYEFSIQKATEEGEIGKICDERIIVKKVGYDGALLQKSRTVFDSNSRDAVKNGRKFKARIVGKKNNGVSTWIEEDDLSVERNEAFSEGRSVFFGCETIMLLDATDFGDDPYDDNKRAFLLPGSDYDYLILLQNVVSRKIKIAAVAALNVFENSYYPFAFSDNDLHIFNEEGIATIPGETETELSAYVENMSIIISEIIPGLKLQYEVLDTKVTREETGDFLISLKKRIGQEITEDDYWHYSVEKKIRLFTEREGIKVPITDESEGIKRLIYEMAVFAQAFNDPGTIAVIDEFDAGIYEYLLGEMLELFERFGQGQFVFTSHNLRPLEVLSRKFICFTTTNKNNRYVKIKNLGKTNNLRDVYLRIIYANDREEKLYEKRKSYQIADAFRKAGKFI